MPFGGHGIAQPVEQPAPVVGADQYDREVPDLPGLDQRERLEQLVGVPNPPGKTTNALA